MSEFDQEFEVEEPKRRLNIFNILTALVLVLTVMMMLCYGFILVAPGILPESFQPKSGGSQAVLLSTAAPAPTITPSSTEITIEGIPPTWTPSHTVGPTETSTPRYTPSHTPTPSLTPTFNPTFTPTPTATPTETPTETPTPGPSPTPAPTRSAYPFTMDNISPVYTANYANAAGCNWMGVAGQVFDLSGQPVPGGAYMIWVTEGGINQQVFTGTALAYGPSGWEVFLGQDHPVVLTYRIQLFSPNGTPVSQVYEFTTRASCNQNLTIINFVQNH